MIHRCQTCLGLSTNCEGQFPPGNGLLFCTLFLPIVLSRYQPFHALFHIYTGLYLYLYTQCTGFSVLCTVLYNWFLLAKSSSQKLIFLSRKNHLVATYVTPINIFLVMLLNFQSCFTTKWPFTKFRIIWVTNCI